MISSIYSLSVTFVQERERVLVYGIRYLVQVCDMSVVLRRILLEMSVPACCDVLATEHPCPRGQQRGFIDVQRDRDCAAAASRGE